MATLTIRNVPDSTRDALRIRAAKNGRSMEAELRLIVEGAADRRHRTGNELDSPPARPVPEAYLSAIEALKASLPETLSADEMLEEFLQERRANAANE